LDKNYRSALIPAIGVITAGVLLTSVLGHAEAATTLALKKLNITLKADKNPIVRGDVQIIRYKVTDAEGKPVKDVSITSTISYASDTAVRTIKGKTDANGNWSFIWKIDAKAKSGLVGVGGKAVKQGYDNGYGATFFKVVSK
jgi:hypothetical protein